MATAQPDDNAPSSSVSTPVSAKRNTKFHETDRRHSNIHTEEVTNTKHIPTSKSPNTNLPIINLSIDKSDYKTHGATTKQSVNSLIAAIETSGKSYAPPITPRQTSARKFQPYESHKRKSAAVTDALPRQDQDLTATLPKPNNTTESFCGTPPPLQLKGANLPISPPRLETSGKSYAPPITPRKTSARKFQSYESHKRKSASVTDALPRQDQDLTATLPKPNNTTEAFCGTPPLLQLKGTNLPISPPRPYSANETTENLLQKQDSDISSEVDFSNGCDFCGKPDDDNIDAALCHVCQQCFCLECLKLHKKCSSTKNHEIAYKFNLLQQTDDDTMSILGMCDEYKSLEDTQNGEQSIRDDRSGSDSQTEDQNADETPILFCNLCDAGTENAYIDEAVANCKECETKMCTGCLKVHQQDKSKQQHNIENLQLMKNTQLDKFLNKSKCKLHPKWSRRYFCKIHTEIICINCSADEKHEDCTEFIVDLHKASKGQNIDKRTTERKLDELKSLSDELSRITDTFTTSLEDMDVKNRDFKEQIKLQQTAMESQLNLAVTSGINIFDNQLESLKLKGNENQNIKCLLQRQIIEFDELLKSGSKEKIFIKQTSIESAVQKFGTILKELQSPVAFCFKMTENSEVDGLIKDSENAKELIIKEKLTIQRPFLDREAVFTNEVVLSNFMTTDVVGMEMLHDETLLVCNKSTKEIARFDNELKLTCALKLNSAPTSMAVISNSSIIVSLPTENSLQHINVDNKQILSTVKKVKTKLPCLQISQFKMDLVAVVKDALCNCIVPLHIDGAFHASIFIDKDRILQDIQSMTANQDHTVIYITEQDQGCIGISMEGDIVFKYKSDSIQVYKGICTDYFGNVYLAEKSADNVVVVNNDGEKIKDIVTMQGLQPKIIKFNHAKDKLVIESSGITNKIRIFTLI